MERTILHMDLDTFFVSVERLLDSRLNHKPILVGGTGQRGVVSACSYETRGFGIYSGMSMKLAQALCPEAIVIRGNAEAYTNHSKMITDIIRESVPVLEKASIDEFYADLSGMDRFFGCYKMSTELRQRIISHTGLPISFGLSQNKTVSKVATGEAKPNNQLKVDTGQERPFLSPLSIRKIPMVGTRTFQVLSNLGVKQVGTLQQMPVEMLQSVLGKNGAEIWRRANGIDETPVQPYTERKSISTERTFETDTIDIQYLKALIKAMAEQLAFQLRKKEKVTACISVKIRYSDFNTHTKQMKIPYTSADHHLIPRVAELFDQLYNRRLLVRLVGVRFSDLVHGHYQINLFEDTQEIIRLYQAMDRIRNRYGSNSIARARTFNMQSLRNKKAPDKERFFL